MIQAFTFWDTAARRERVRFTDSGKVLFIMDFDDFVKLPPVRYAISEALNAAAPAPSKTA